MLNKNKTEVFEKFDNGFENDEAEEQLDNKISIINSMMLSIQNVDGNKMDTVDLNRTKDYIMNVMQSNVCLICIDLVKNNDPCWNCSYCFTMLHMQCTQMWVREGIHQKSLLSPQLFPNKEKIWHCPKCRGEYREKDIPKRYYCFCGQTDDPTFNPWIFPHSCGNLCSKKLGDGCTHKCLMLCHPGPCPPCPQTVSMTCHCGASRLQKKRCGQAKWSCNKTCNNILICNLHKCTLHCHSGNCEQCTKLKSLKCECGRNMKNHLCSTKSWKCTEVCGKILSCGYHKCEKVCHNFECGTCPKFGDRTCPCGKTKFDLPCTTEVPTCLESCSKLLDCNQHYCTLKCHFGPCGICREMSIKKCRCGKHKKELQCFKEYFCETKCLKMKSCGIHQCKRKCCDGNCPPCNVICSKLLSCKNHKCQAECHEGRCYPCVLTIELSCNCGLTKLNIPCGAEKFTKNPRCIKSCKAAPLCHHPNQENHHCHMGACPPCKQVCDKPRPCCNHKCQLSCHSAVKIKTKSNEVRVGPWDVKNLDKYETVALDCPPCSVIVDVYCLGKHECIGMQCSEAGIRSCGRKCGRQLNCQRHHCQLECHTIEGVTDDDFIHAGKTCEKCESVCDKERPEGCIHACLLMCHSGACPPCKQMLRMRCHCQLVVRYVECSVWLASDAAAKLKLQSCGAQCPKMLPCGHRCKDTCHEGKCSTLQPCIEKVRVRCKCKRRKVDFKCFEEKQTIECDQMCVANMEKINRLKEEQECERLAKESEKKKQELEQFDRLMSSGRRKKKKVPTATLR